MGVSGSLRYLGGDQALAPRSMAVRGANGIGLTATPAEAPDDEPKLEGIDGSGTDMGRLLALSDGVFAFALTFLAVTILLPQVSGTVPPSLPAYLRRLEPAFVGYLLSFFVVGAWWNTHHRLFSSIVRYDQRLVRLNSLFLLVISVTPFLVSLLFAYSASGWGQSSASSRDAVIIYAVVQALGGCALLGIWRHATAGHRLVRPTLSAEWIRATESRELVTVLTFASSIAIAFVSPLLAELVWIAMIFGLGRGIWRRSAPKSRA